MNSLFSKHWTPRRAVASKQIFGTFHHLSSPSFHDQKVKTSEAYYKISYNILYLLSSGWGCSSGRDGLPPSFGGFEDCGRMGQSDERAHDAIRRGEWENDNGTLIHPLIYSYSYHWNIKSSRKSHKINSMLFEAII